jgi:hypothetical protein
MEYDVRLWVMGYMGMGVVWKKKEFGRIGKCTPSPFPAYCTDLYH